MKAWVQRYCTVEMWKEAGEELLNAAMFLSTSYERVGGKTFAMCGYELGKPLGRLLPRVLLTRGQALFPYLRMHSNAGRVLVPLTPDEIGCCESESDSFYSASEGDGAYEDEGFYSGIEY